VRSNVKATPSKCGDGWISGRCASLTYLTERFGLDNAEPRRSVPRNVCVPPLRTCSSAPACESVPRMFALRVRRSMIERLFAPGARGCESIDYSSPSVAHGISLSPTVAQGGEISMWAIRLADPAGRLAQGGRRSSESDLPGGGRNAHRVGSSRIARRSYRGLTTGRGNGISCEFFRPAALRKPGGTLIC